MSHAKSLAALEARIAIQTDEHEYLFMRMIVAEWRYSRAITLSPFRREHCQLKRRYLAAVNLYDLKSGRITYYESR